MSDDLTSKPCERCGAEMGQIIRACTWTRVGWYCEACGYFDKAEWRERLVNDPASYSSFDISADPASAPPPSTPK